MLIKNYTTGGDLFVIDNAENIFVHSGRYRETDLGPTNPSYPPDTLISFYNELAPSHELADASCRFVDFFRKGEQQRLRVYGKAYVCNADGKTIEKVSPETA